MVDIWSGYYAADMNCSSHRIGFDKQSLAKTISHKVYFFMHIPPILYHECWRLWYLEDPIIFNEYPGLTPTLCQIAFHSCNCAMWLWCNLSWRVIKCHWGLTCHLHWLCSTITTTFCSKVIGIHALVCFQLSHHKFIKTFFLIKFCGTQHLITNLLGGEANM